MMKRIILFSLLLGLTPFAKANFFLPLACKINSEIPSPLGQAKDLNPQVLSLALKAYTCALKTGYSDPRHILTIIDYTIPSSQKRLWVIDLAHKQVLFHTLVAQGKYTGDLVARYFSDKPESKESSIGLFLTGEPYVGHDGYSLHINGLEAGFNDKAEAREIVIHGAWYVSDSFAKRMGRVGLSWGCPAVPEDVVKPMIDTIKDGTFLFSYYPNPQWLASSKFLNCPVSNVSAYSKALKTLSPAIYSKSASGTKTSP